MSVITNNLLLGDEGYFLTKSLRFRSSASAYLSRTPASAGNRQIWTWSGWIKRGILGGASNVIFNCYNTTSTTQTSFEFSNDTFGVFSNDSSTVNVNLFTTQVFRDPSAWYHIVVAFDSTQATSSNRVKIYINGSQVTAFSSSTYPSLNYNSHINTTSLHTTFATRTPSGLTDGYLTENNFIDGQALTPSSFGETSTSTGVWIPKKYTGTYGTNGFYLDFKDTSSVAALGYDAAGSNDWTVNNISLTSGSTYDSMKDVPTLTDTDTANYAVLNPIHYNALGNAITNGNLTGDSITSATSPFRRTYPSTIQVSSGKWYCELTVGSIGNGFELGIVSAFNTNGIRSTYYAYNFYDQVYDVSGSTVSYGVRATAGQVIGMAVDLNAGTIEWFVNNSSQGQKTGIAAGNYFLHTDMGFNNPAQSGSINFGQRPFAYTPPSGFVALNTFNLPTPTIGATASSQANKYFDVLTWTGDGTTSRSLTGLSFQPDFVWIKQRSTSISHTLYNSIVGGGANKSLASNNTDSESLTNANSVYGYLNTFDSNGFSVVRGSDGSISYTNVNSGTYVAWNWKANGSGSTNTAGSITSTVSANTTAGFSVVIYTGTGANATVGHGLGVAPSMVLYKNRSAATAWIVYHSSLSGTGQYLVLNTTGAVATDTTQLPSAPSSTILNIGSANNVNGSTNNHVAYCFAQVAGYSAFGSYTGNGSTDGTMVFTGFRPKYVLIKNSSASSTNWFVYDSARSSYNVVDDLILANASTAEYANNSSYELDFLSNGFKIKDTDSQFNGNGNTLIYAAFAETPFKYSLAR